MLWYTWVPKDELDPIRERGISSGVGPPVRLWRFVPAGVPQGGSALLVVDERKLNAGPQDGSALWPVEHVPAEAVCNNQPYARPCPVTAAGGYVLRRAADGFLQVLAIYRRGVWDLPKGKQDAGESVRCCAAREVCEEVGAGEISIRGSLGFTRHGYIRENRYHVKTTYWYLMTTASTAFIPQQQENIEAVDWLGWDEASEKLGFETLRSHMRQISGRVEKLAAGVIEHRKQPRAK